MNIGVVVIGRNEAKHLFDCLRSVLVQTSRVVYVDSGSSDASIHIAKSAGVVVHELDASIPFSAARARNEGVLALRALYPELDIVQFLDGDCTLAPRWLESVSVAFSEDDQLGVVLGHLSERDPDASIYNRLCALEWKAAAGYITQHGSLGGIFAVQSALFLRLNGFREEVIAGEDSEFGVRVTLAGRQILKLNAPMATHDAAIYTLSVWWRRCIRAGHAIAQRRDLNGDTAVRDCVKERKSVLFWALVVPGAAALIGILTSWWLGVAAFSSAYSLLVFRILRFRRRLGDSLYDGLLYAVAIAAAKFANLQGMLRYWRNKRRGRYSIIE